MKGLSGGERKRTSIGYELITSPNLLLLDEPTSGMDSKTAYQIIKILREEAKRGMTVIATIHQPSSELFAMFHRVALLSDGYTLYNGPNKNLITFLKSLRVEVPKHFNPADFIIKIAIDPTLVDPLLSIHTLTREQNAFYERQLEDVPKIHNKGLRVTMIGQQRQASFWLQFKLLFNRNMVFIVRNPLALYALLGISIFMAMLVSAIYHGVAGKRFSIEEGASYNFQIMTEWIGLIFFLAMD
jgi:ATP-binding cassette subfamily G (WHITE) protein 1